MSDTWKIQLTIAVNFISSKDSDEECVMHSKSDNIELMINNKAEEVIEELFETFLNRHQIGLETSIRDSDFVFDCFYLLYYKCHKIKFKLDGSFTDSPNWIKNKKETRNPINKKFNKCLIEKIECLNV